MDENKNEFGIVKIAAGIVIASVVAPVAFAVIGGTCNTIANAVDRVKSKRKIKKGLKDGSITEIDGEYYEVMIEDVEEA